ncbi:MAG: TatD family hydrolase [Acutalibacteraceae bacterium]
MYKNIFDAHCHFDDEMFIHDIDELLNMLPKKGVSYAVTNGTDHKNFPRVLELTEKYDYIYGTAGYHPECLDEIPENYIDIVESYLKKPKFVAVGEIGLDYHYDTPKEVQMPVVKRHLELAKDIDKPIVFHDREAHGDTLDLMRKYRPKGLIHCFSGSAEMMKEIIDLGLSISLGGVVTFKNAKHPLEVAKEVPLERLLLETDAPYMTPVPYRGKRNDPSLIPFTAEKIAELRNMDTQKLIDITTDNAKRLFGID